jgi:hypothetical protein
MAESPGAPLSYYVMKQLKQRSESRSRSRTAKAASHPA